jgi:predicted DNA-binding transcriptional regulator YafY
VSALNSFILPLTHTGPTVDAEALAVIAGACRDYEMLRFNYHSRDGAATTREVEPHRLVHTGHRWYLAAWDIGRKNWRTFRIDRIQPKIASGLRFTPRQPPDGDFAVYVSKSVSYAPDKHQAKVVFHASLEAVSERIPPAAGTLEAIDDQTCVLHTGSSSLDSLSVYLALIGFEFEVREPPELVERVRLLAERFTRATG